MTTIDKTNNSDLDDDELESVDLSDDDEIKAPERKSQPSPKKVKFHSILKKPTLQVGTPVVKSVIANVPVPTPAHVPVPIPAPVSIPLTVQHAPVPVFVPVTVTNKVNHIEVKINDIIPLSNWVLKLEKLRIFLWMSAISIIVSCFLALYALIATSATGLSPTLLTLVIAIVASFSIATTKLMSYKSNFIRIVESSDFLLLQKCHTQFFNTSMISLGMLIILITSSFITLFVIIFQLRTANYCPIGVFQSFEAMDKNGQAIFILLFLNAVFGGFAIISTATQSNLLHQYYLLQSWVVKEK